MTHIFASRGFLLVATLFAGSVASAQIAGGDLVGTVKDASGAVLSGATVSVTSESTRITVVAKTNKSGQYHADNLLPAPYDVKVEASGFSIYVLKGVSIDLNKTSTADAVLAVSSASSVEVDSVASVNLDTTSNNLTTTFSSVELTELPTTESGFGALNASLLAPNVASGGGVGIGTGPSVGGQRPRNNNYTIEGIDVNSKSVTGPIIEVPGDATGQFTLITSQFSPEFGHSSGGQFDTTVISGTNQFHGKAYEYFQNRNLNAENAIKGGKVPNPRYDSNRYGGQIGGPILRDKLFFFANYQRSETGQSLQGFVCVPTAAGFAQLQGLVAPDGLSANNVGQFTKYVPVANYAGGAQVTNANDNACFNQASGGQTFAVDSGTTFSSTEPYPSATSANGIYGSGTQTNVALGNYLIAAPTFSNTDYLTTSADYTLSSKDNFRFRYLYVTQGSQDTSASLPVFYEASPLKLHLGTLSEFHSFTPNLSNEIRIGYNRQATATPVGNFSYPGLDSFPNITLYDLGGVNIGPDPNGPQSGIQNLYQAVDNVSYTKGTHQITLGFDGRKYIAPQSFTQRVRGDYEWGYTTEFFHDLAPTYFGQRSTGNFFYYGDQTAFYGYANDTWRATPKLTLNYGLRYEFTSVPTGERAQALNSAASVAGLITFSAPQPSYKSFAPRLGVAYAVDEKTSIRAGFGISYDVLFDNIGLLSFPPQYSATTNVLAPGPGAYTTYGAPNFLANGGLPPGTGTLNTYATLAAQRAATSAYLPNQVVPYAESYNLTIQHVVARDYTVEVQYLGTRGIHLPQQNQLNKQAKVTAANQLTTYLNGPVVDPTNSFATLSTAANVNTLAPIQALSAITAPFLAAGFTTSLTSYQPFGASNYNGLGFNLTRRMQHGLQLNSSYTYSKTMDNSTAEVNASILSQRRAQDSRNVAADYSLSGLSRKNRYTLELVYAEPFFAHSHLYLKDTLGGWVVSPIYTYESPEFVTPSSETNSNLNGDSGGISRTYINGAGNRAVGSGVYTVYSTNPALTGLCTGASAATGRCAASTVGYLAKNPNAYYITSGSGTLPTASRNTLAGQPIDNLDLSASKKIAITERFGFEFQALAFNVLNHSQFVPGAISNIAGTSTAGNATAYINPASAAFNIPGKEYTAHARSMVLVGKFVF